MEELLVYVLILLLIVNVFNIGMIIRVARMLGSMDAFSEEKAIELKDPFYKIYLFGPMVSWANLKRTNENKYWLDLKRWNILRIVMFAVLTFLLFANVYLLLFFIDVY